MKNMKRFLTLFLALSLMLSMTAFAGDPGTIKEIVIEADDVEVDYEDGDVNFELTHAGATNGGMYLVLVLSSDGTPTNSNILYVNQETAGSNGVTFDNIYPKEIVDSYIYMAGTDMAYTKLGTIVPNVAAADVTVKAIGNGANIPAYTVDGRNVTVTHNVPCKLGYQKADGTYTAIAATDNGDGSYSYVVPEGVSEVTVVVKGDVTGDGRLMANDSVQVKAAQLRKQTFTDLQNFAADVTGDGRLMANDSVQVKAAQLRKTALAW